MKLLLLLIIALLVLVAFQFVVAKLNGRDHIWLWDAPMNSASLWWDWSQSNKIGWSDLRRKRDNHSFWFVLWGVCFTLTVQTWPFASLLRERFRNA